MPPIEMDDAHLISFAAEFRDGILGGRAPHGMCAAVCWPLAGLLRAHGLDVREQEIAFHADDAPCRNHVLLRLPDGRILDPTADQFEIDELEAVYLGPMPVIYEIWMREP